MTNTIFLLIIGGLCLLGGILTSINWIIYEWKETKKLTWSLLWLSLPMWLFCIVVPPIGIGLLFYIPFIWMGVCSGD